VDVVFKHLRSFAWGRVAADGQIFPVGSGCYHGSTHCIWGRPK